jgi:tRNA(Ile)-lysidine synthase
MVALGKIKKTIQKYRMLEPGDGVVVGVSGGPDSVMLCHVLYRLCDRCGLTLTVAHLNHGIRGAEAARDARFVERFARGMGLPCVVQEQDVPAYCRERSRSLQEAAREVRYRFLEDVRGKVGAAKIALGHNADDQAETVMLWLLRGAGLKGLGGMPPVRNGIIIRPLIETTREEIETYLRAKGIAFVTDSSNRKGTYVRNRLRRQVFPLLKKHFNPQLVKSLVSTASIISMENEYLETMAHNKLKSIVASRNDASAVIDCTRFAGLPPVLRLRCLRTILEGIKGDLRRIGAEHLYALTAVMTGDEPHKTLKLPGGMRADRSYRFLTLTTRPATTPPAFSYQFASLPAQAVIPEIGKRMLFTLVPGCRGAAPDRRPSVACLDAGKAVMPLTIRSVQPGDAMHPLGMEGRKKVQDLFTDAKVPRAERKRIPLFWFGDELAWVGGMRISQRLRVTGKTRTVLRIEMVPQGGSG